MRRYAAFGGYGSSVSRIRGKRLVGAYRREKEGLQGAGKMGDFWKIIAALIDCANGNSGKKGKEGCFCPTARIGLFQSIGFIPTKVRNPPQEIGRT